MVVEIGTYSLPKEVGFKGWVAFDRTIAFECGWLCKKCADEVFQLMREAAREPAITGNRKNEDY